MSVPSPLPGSLDSLAKTFERLSMRALEASLPSGAAVSEAFHATDAPPAASLLYCLIPSSNLQYHIQLAVGLAKDDLPAFFPAERDAARRMDALSSLSGRVASLLVSDVDFIGRFGSLKACTPFFSEGAFSDRRDIGIRGSLDSDGRKLDFHMTVRRAGMETWHGEPTA